MRRFPRFRHKSGRLLRMHHLLIAMVFTLIIVSLLVIANIGMDVLTSMRAYVGGEGLWSKAQKDAVHYLLRYGKFRSEADYERYLQAIQAPLASKSSARARSSELSFALSTDCFSASWRSLKRRCRSTDEGASLISRFQSISWSRTSGRASAGCEGPKSIKASPAPTKSTAATALPQNTLRRLGRAFGAGAGDGGCARRSRSAAFDDSASAGNG